MRTSPFLDALSLSNTSKAIPVWLMRQAGRYMHSYKNLRKKYSFEDLCFTTELCIETTLQPIRAFDFDAAIIFSDILFPLRILGINVQFFDTGPTVHSPENKITLPNNYKEALLTLFHPLYAAAKILKQTLDRPLIGFAGAPCTLSAFILEGRGSTEWSLTKKSFSKDIGRFMSLIPILEEIVTSHLQFQIDAGCQAVQIFDSLAHIVPPHLEQLLIVEPLQRILSRLPSCPVIYYKATNELLPNLPTIPLSLASNVDLIPLATDYSRALQGNLNPAILQFSSKQISGEILHICSIMKKHPGFIFNLSSGIPQNTPEKAIQLLVDTVRSIDRF